MISEVSRQESGTRVGGTRLPRHIGLIPDGNRRWARARGLPSAAGYAAGVGPGLRLLECAEAAGIEDVTAYGYTKENVCRPRDQVRAFERACIDLAELAMARGTALLVVGDVGSRRFPDVLRPWAYQRSPGRLRFNLVVNYNWQWDLLARQAPSARTRAQAHQTSSGTWAPVTSRGWTWSCVGVVGAGCQVSSRYSAPTPTSAYWTRYGARHV